MAYASYLEYPSVPISFGDPIRLPPIRPFLKFLPYFGAAYLVYRLYEEYNARSREPAQAVTWKSGTTWEHRVYCGGQGAVWYTGASWPNNSCGLIDVSHNPPFPPHLFGDDATAVSWFTTEKAGSASTRRVEGWVRTLGTGRLVPLAFEDPILWQYPTENLEEILRRVLPQVAPWASGYPQTRPVPWAWVPRLSSVDGAGVQIRGNVVPRPGVRNRPIALPGINVHGEKIEYPAWVEALRTVAKPGQKVQTQPGKHLEGPPKAKTKERKLRTKSGNVARVIWHAVNSLTEACDLVDALYNALPKITRAQYDKKLAAKGRYQNWRRFQSRKMVDGLNTERGAPMKSNNVYDWTSGTQACIWKARIVYKELDLINMDQAIINIARETLTDVVIGKLMQGTNPISQKLGRGVQLGSWDNPHFNVNG